MYIIHIATVIIIFNITYGSIVEAKPDYESSIIKTLDNPFTPNDVNT
jgi:hypothetical protein